MSNHSSSSTIDSTTTKQNDGQQGNGSSASSNNGQISSSSLDFLVKLNDSEPTHGLLVPSKKRTNSNFAYTMILRGHTYHVCYRRQTPRGERVYWRCQLRGQCKARLITDLDGKIVQFTNPVHSHPSSARLNTQQQRCIQALLTTVEENIDLLKGTNSENLLMPTSSSPDNEEENFGALVNGCPPTITPPPSTLFFESPPNTSSTLSSTNGELPTVTQPSPSSFQKHPRKRHKNSVTKAQQTGEIDIEEVLRQIPQLQTLRFANYYNGQAEKGVEDEEEDEEVQEGQDGQEDDEDENNNASSQTQQNGKETDETVYEDTDSSSIASPSHLNETQRRSLLDSLVQSGWKTSQNGRDQIHKTFEFLDFNETFGFMNRVALKAEAIHRHPKWTNVYNRLEISFPAQPQQHTLTIADLHLAKFMDEIFNSHHH